MLLRAGVNTMPYGEKPAMAAGGDAGIWQACCSYKRATGGGGFSGSWRGINRGGYLMAWRRQLLK